MCLLVWYWYELWKLTTEPHTLSQHCRLQCITTDHGNLILGCSRSFTCTNYNLYPPFAVFLYTVEIIYQCMFVSFKAHWQTMLFMLLRASCLTLEIKGFRCYEVKIEWKGWQSLGVKNPGHPWLEPPVLCHWATTAGQPPTPTKPC